MALNVLYVTMQFPVPSETFAAVEIRALQALEIRVSVATFKPKPPNCGEILSERGLQGLKIDHNSLISSLRGLWVAVRQPSLSLRLLRTLLADGSMTTKSFMKSLALIPRTLDLFTQIRRSPPDIVHLYWGHYPSLLGLLVHHLIEDVPVSLSLSAYDLHSRYGPSIELGKLAPLTLTLAQANVPDLRAFGLEEERIHVVYHGVDTSEQVAENLTKEAAEIVIAERLIPLKRTADSLMVFRKILDQKPEATLTLLGDGPERDRLAGLASELGLSDSVRFAGHVEHQEVFAHFDAAKVLLSMSSSERLPNTVKEAMLRDCIPVVARTVGIEELIDHGATGFVVEQGEIDAAANAVVTCLNDWDSLQSLRAAAREHISESFSSRGLAIRRRDLWREAISRRRNSLTAREPDR